MMMESSKQFWMARALAVLYLCSAMVLFNAGHSVAVISSLTDRSLSTGTKMVRTAAENQHAVADSSCRPPAVAFMFSGQWSRFIYKDNLEPLVTWHPSDTACGEPEIDVYISLHKGSIATAWTGHIDTPPYMTNNTKDVLADIKMHYQNRGAHKVFIQLLDDDHMNKMEADVWKVQSTRHLVADNPLIEMIKEHYDKRYSRIKMFYLRYAAFRMALEQGHRYSAFVALREDAYMSPLDFSAIGYDHSLALMLDGKGDKRDAESYVFIEKYCSWNRAPSDKVHIGNQMAMITLWGENWPGFVNHMLHWAGIAFLRSHGQNRMEREDPFQTEAYLADLLATARLTKTGLIPRIDGRYVNGTLCQHASYMKCRTKDKNEAKRLAEINVPVCPGT